MPDRGICSQMPVAAAYGDDPQKEAMSQRKRSGKKFQPGDKPTQKRGKGESYVITSYSTKGTEE